MVRLLDYIADVINDNEKSIKIANDKIERLESNIKMLEDQYKSVVSDKFNATKNLSIIQTQCEKFQSELKLLKQKNGKQEIKMNDLKREIDAFDEDKKKISKKFKLLKRQEKVHDTVVGSLKRKFEEEITEFLKEDASRKDDLEDPSTNVEASNESTSGNKANISMSPDLDKKGGDRVPNTVASTIVKLGANLVAGASSNPMERVNTQMMANVAGVKMHKLKVFYQTVNIMFIFSLQVAVIIIPRNQLYKADIRLVPIRIFSNVKNGTFINFRF